MIDSRRRTGHRGDEGHWAGRSTSSFTITHKQWATALPVDDGLGQ